MTTQSQGIRFRDVLVVKRRKRVLRPMFVFNITVSPPEYLDTAENVFSPGVTGGAGTATYNVSLYV